MSLHSTRRLKVGYRVSGFFKKILNKTIEKGDDLLFE